MQSAPVQKAVSHWFYPKQYSPVGVNCLIYIVFVYSNIYTGIIFFCASFLVASLNLEAFILIFLTAF